MEVHNVALVSLLAIQVMIVKRSQDVSYWSKNKKLSWCWQQARRV